ncbi:MAG: hypothetical protein H7138_25675 [Myxococcales bacterium]|nr:hypothetical protein [Myxococcales bacterium]
MKRRRGYPLLGRFKLVDCFQNVAELLHSTSRQHVRTPNDCFVVYHNAYLVPRRPLETL